MTLARSHASLASRGKTEMEAPAPATEAPTPASSSRGKTEMEALQQTLAEIAKGIEELREKREELNKSIAAGDAETGTLAQNRDYYVATHSPL